MGQDESDCENGKSTEKVMSLEEMWTKLRKKHLSYGRMGKLNPAPCEIKVLKDWRTQLWTEAAQAMRKTLVCENCGGNGFSGVDDFGNVVACENCGGQKDCLGTGLKPSCNYEVDKPSQIVAELEKRNG